MNPFDPTPEPHLIGLCKRGGGWQWVIVENGAEAARLCNAWANRGGGTSAQLLKFAQSEFQKLAGTR